MGYFINIKMYFFTNLHMNENTPPIHCRESLIITHKSIRNVETQSHLRITAVQNLCLHTASQRAPLWKTLSDLCH